MTHPIIRPGHGSLYEAEGMGPTGIDFVDGLVAWTKEQMEQLDEADRDQSVGRVAVGASQSVELSEQDGRS